MTDPAWFRSAVVYQVYPRSFADSDGDGIGDLRGITRHLDHLEALGVDVLWLSSGLPVAAGRQRLRHQRLPGDRPGLRHPGRLRRAAREAVHARGMRLVMDLVVNHTSDEHPWFVESRSSRDNPKRDWYWWRPPRARTREPGAEPTTGARSSPGRPGSWTRPPASTTCTCSRRKQPDLNWENPEVRAGGLRDDALVAGPGCRRLPDGRHQPHLQGPGAARRPRAAPAARTATARRTCSAARGCTSSSRRCTARCSPAATASC